MSIWGGSRYEGDERRHDGAAWRRWRRLVRYATRAALARRFACVCVGGWSTYHTRALSLSLSHASAPRLNEHTHTHEADVGVDRQPPQLEAAVRAGVGTSEAASSTAAQQQQARERRHRQTQKRERRSTEERRATTEAAALQSLGGPRAFLNSACPVLGFHC